MKNKIEEYDEINPHGWRILIYKSGDKVKIYNHDNIPSYDFKPICDREIDWLMLEGFIERKKIKIEMATITPVEEEKSKK